MKKGQNRGPEALSMVKILAQKAPFSLSVALSLNYSAPPLRTFAQYRASIGPNWSQWSAFGNPDENP
jgi:hypothetical protein